MPDILSLGEPMWEMSAIPSEPGKYTLGYGGAVVSFHFRLLSSLIRHFRYLHTSDVLWTPKTLCHKNYFLQNIL